MHFFDSIIIHDVGSSIERGLAISQLISSSTTSNASGTTSTAASLKCLMKNSDIKDDNGVSVTCDSFGNGIDPICIRYQFLTSTVSGCFPKTQAGLDTCSFIRSFADKTCCCSKDNCNTKDCDSFNSGSSNGNTGGNSDLDDKDKKKDICFARYQGDLESSAPCQFPFVYKNEETGVSKSFASCASTKDAIPYGFDSSKNQNNIMWCPIKKGVNKKNEYSFTSLQNRDKWGTCECMSNGILQKCDIGTSPASSNNLVGPVTAGQCKFPFRLVDSNQKSIWFYTCVPFSILQPYIPSSLGTSPSTYSFSGASWCPTATGLNSDSWYLKNDTTFNANWGICNICVDDLDGQSNVVPGVTEAPTLAPLEYEFTETPTRKPTTAGPSTRAPTKAPTITPTTRAPNAGTLSPTTANPTSKSPTKAPTNTPTTARPTLDPTNAPSTRTPTRPPTNAPTTSRPTTKRPTESPITLYEYVGNTPSKAPTRTPTTNRPTTRTPTNAPTLTPTTRAPNAGTLSPTTSNPTSKSPTQAPTNTPTTSSPTTASPTTSSPTTARPTTASPSTPSPTALGPTTRSPTLKPTTLSPTNQPTDVPTKKITSVPSKAPTRAPTKRPTTPSPTAQPTDAPTKKITSSPTKAPTRRPTTPSPTNQPTEQPTEEPTKKPSSTPTSNPTKAPTRKPTTNSPTSSPTTEPTFIPTRQPTEAPTTKKPTKRPTTKAPTEPDEGTDAPTMMPTSKPTRRPTASPTYSSLIKELDVYIHADMSRSISMANPECVKQTGIKCWNLQVNFAVELQAKLATQLGGYYDPNSGSPNGLRFWLSTFTCKDGRPITNVLTQLTGNKAEINGALANMAALKPYLGTCPTQGLNYILNSIQEHNGDIGRLNKAVIIITDGRFDDTDSNTASPVTKKIMDYQSEVFAVAVGKGIDTQQLKDVTHDQSGSRIVDIDSFPTLALSAPRVVQFALKFFEKPTKQPTNFVPISKQPTLKPTQKPTVLTPSPTRRPTPKPDPRATLPPINDFPTPSPTKYPTPFPTAYPTSDGIPRPTIAPIVKGGHGNSNGGDGGNEGTNTPSVDMYESATDIPSIDSTDIPTISSSSIPSNAPSIANVPPTSGNTPATNSPTNDPNGDSNNKDNQQNSGDGNKKTENVGNSPNSATAPVLIVLFLVFAVAAVFAWRRRKANAASAANKNNSNQVPENRLVTFQGQGKQAKADSNKSSESHKT